MEQSNEFRDELVAEFEKQETDGTYSSEEGRDPAGLVASGFFWVVGGIVATAVSYNMASDGGVFFVFWGAVVFGIWNILRGVFGMAAGEN